ncbi:MAG: phosphoribosyltransferase family protein [Acidobacteriota bacterium]
MELIPTQEEVVALLRRTGGLRSGHFEYPDRKHVSEYLQVALTMRDFNTSNILSVALSRKLRSNSDLRALLPKLSVAAPATGGLPVAYGVSEALRARKVFWAERESPSEAMHFREYLELEPGEKVVLVDDIFRSGTKLAEMKKLVESAGGEVLAMGVIVYQPIADAADFGSLPFYYLAKLDAAFTDADVCEQCKRGEPVAKVRL